MSYVCPYFPALKPESIDFITIFSCKGKWICLQYYIPLECTVWDSGNRIKYKGNMPKNQDGFKRGYFI